MSDRRRQFGESGALAELRLPASSLHARGRDEADLQSPKMAARGYDVVGSAVSIIPDLQQDIGRDSRSSCGRSRLE